MLGPQVPAVAGWYAAVEGCLGVGSESCLLLLPCKQEDPASKPVRQELVHLALMAAQWWGLRTCTDSSHQQRVLRRVWACPAPVLLVDPHLVYPSSGFKLSLSTQGTQGAAYSRADSCICPREGGICAYVLAGARGECQLSSAHKTGTISATVHAVSLPHVSGLRKAGPAGQHLGGLPWLGGT